MEAMDVDSVLGDFLLDMGELERQSLPMTLKEESLETLTSSLVALESNPLVNQDYAKQTPKKHVGRRHQIAALQEEADVLTLQLTRLNCERLLVRQRALQEIATSCPLRMAHWKQRAQQEEVAKQNSQEENQRLAHYIATNASRIATIQTFLTQQKRSMLPSPQRNLRQFVLSDADEDDTFVYQMLKDNVSVQHAQLDAVLAQCMARIDADFHRESCIHMDGAGIDVHSFSISPFPIAVLNEAMRRYIQEGHTQASMGTTADGSIFMRKFIKPPPSKGRKAKLLQHQTGGSPVMRSRSVFKRIANGDTLVFIWASMLDWQDESLNSSAGLINRPTICKNGWSVIKPLSRDTEYASFNQSIESTNIYRSDGSSRHTIDSETNDVLRLIESCSEEESQIIENLAFDANIERRKISR